MFVENALERHKNNNNINEKKTKNRRQKQQQQQGFVWKDTENKKSPGERFVDTHSSRHTKMEIPTWERSVEYRKKEYSFGLGRNNSTQKKRNPRTFCDTRIDLEKKNNEETTNNLVNIERNKQKFFGIR